VFDELIYTLEQIDFWSALILIGALYMIGDRIVQGRPAMRERGVQCAIAAFGIYCVSAFLTYGSADAPELLGIAFRALLVAGIVLGLSWITLTALAPMGRLLTAPGRLWADHRRQTERTRQYQREQDEGRRREAEQARQRLERADGTQREASAERRRNDARAAAALTYSLYAPKVTERFSRQNFDEFVEMYMGDDHSADDVEKRGQELVRTLQQHLEQVEPPNEKRTLEDLARWFVEQKELIESLTLDDKLKRLHLAELNARYSDLSSNLMTELKP